MFFPFLAIPFHIDYEADWARGLAASLCETRRRCVRNPCTVVLAETRVRLLYATLLELTSFRQ